jgi:hypothetical protein
LFSLSSARAEVLKVFGPKALRIIVLPSPVPVGARAPGQSEAELVVVLLEIHPANSIEAVAAAL